ncbi:MAG: xanthine dehydrogenase accessory protein XdhC [Elusimicrobia bacterium]|nr:xanthine dehydrogenase accessory protein XdhC [Elusimicrobiota bacterium]
MVSFSNTHSPSKILEAFESDLPRPAVLCTIIQVSGSHPQEVGAKMWVTREDFFGTLGGGKFEQEVLRYAHRLLQTPPVQPHLKEYVLCRQMGQCCGGRARVFFEIIPQRKKVHLFGAGHVGRAVSQVLSQMPFQVILVDPRPEWANLNSLPPDIQVRCMDPMEYAHSQTWDENDAICIFTHSHDLDYLLARYFLKHPVGYLGLIGSNHKARVFQARLQSESLEELWEEKMHCPIGLPLESKHPAILAISIAAELLKEWWLTTPLSHLTR